MSYYLCHQSHHRHHHRLRMTSQRLYGEAAWVPSGLLDSLLAENPLVELLKYKKSFYKYFTSGTYGFSCKQICNATKIGIEHEWRHPLLDMPTTLISRNIILTFHYGHVGKF